MGTTMADALVALGVRGAEGTWQFQLKSIEIADGYPAAATIPPTPNVVRVHNTDAAAPAMYVLPAAKSTAKPSPQSPWSGLVDYTHGTPPEPQEFAYVSRPGSTIHVFAWADAYTE